MSTHYFSSNSKMQLVLPLFFTFKIKITEDGLDTLNTVAPHLH